MGAPLCRGGGVPGRAPELLAGRGQSQEVSLWSLGRRPRAEVPTRLGLWPGGQSAVPTGCWAWQRPSWELGGGWRCCIYGAVSGSDHGGDRHGQTTRARRGRAPLWSGWG